MERSSRCAVAARQCVSCLLTGAPMQLKWLPKCLNESVRGSLLVCRRPDTIRDLISMPCYAITEKGQRKDYKRHIDCFLKLVDRGKGGRKGAAKWGSGMPTPFGQPTSPNAHMQQRSQCARGRQMVEIVSRMAYIMMLSTSASSTLSCSHVNNRASRRNDLAMDKAFSHQDCKDEVTLSITE